MCNLTNLNLYTPSATIVAVPIIALTKSSTAIVAGAVLPLLKFLENGYISGVIKIYNSFARPLQVYFPHSVDLLLILKLIAGVICLGQIVVSVWFVAVIVAHIIESKRKGRAI